MDVLGVGMTTWTDADGMKKIFDFDPHEGPHPDESQDEFDQRIEIRDGHWRVLEIIVMGWIDGRYAPEYGAAPRALRRANRLRKWGLAIKMMVDGVVHWEPTAKGLDYYFSDRQEAP